MLFNLEMHESLTEDYQATNKAHIIMNKDLISQ